MGTGFFLWRIPLNKDYSFSPKKDKNYLKIGIEAAKKNILRGIIKRQERP